MAPRVKVVNGFSELLAACDSVDRLGGTYDDADLERAHVAARLLAAWVREQNDGQLCDYDWFKSIGGVELTDEGSVPVEMRLGRGRLIIDLNTADLYLGSEWICEDPSRACVRSLLAALGMEVGR